ncbi:MAG TPA: sigma-54 dependent transcriptional regulator [Polyangia bacterium]|jgi:DNA-binding NtrC family response regulator|nr:sigma-54 dependent transcriptional regulator [Polyangia bacterium]
MHHTARVLIVEDDRVARELLAEILRSEGYEVDAASGGEDALGRLHAGYDLVISDVRLGDGPSGMDLLQAFQQEAPDTPFIIITAFGDVTGAMSAIQLGAHDYVSKPFNIEELVLTVRRALERQRLREETRAQRSQLGEAPDARGGIQVGERMYIVGRSPAMLEVYKTVARVAPSLSTVLVVGESGTGKELVARAIHTYSPRSKGPFVAVNCTALTESLLESELFGHEKGAFTGAVVTKKGLFEEAAGGTLFLDEIGDVGPKMQAQLLRVLQEGRIRRVGGSEEIRVDVRSVAATNRDLEEEVRAKRFREDLYFRLNVVAIRVPSLRERPGDIPLLVQHFIAKYASGPEAGIAPDATEALKRHDWKGNVRELENAVERALALAKNGFILPSDLPPDVLRSVAVASPAGLIDDRPTLAELERRYIELILRETGGNKKRAAEILGIDRRTLYRTLEREGRDREEEEG